MQIAANIVVHVAMYALISCGYVLIYRVSRVLNLAHGELMMLAAYLLLALGTAFGGSPVAALLGAEEFGFATAPLIASGCIMMRK